MQAWSFILSVLGATAWLPILITPLVNICRKISVSLLECRILTSGIGISAITNEKKVGVITLLVVNLFREGADYYPTTIQAAFKLKDGRTYSAEILDFSSITSNYGCKKTMFSIPIDMEFNVSRTIKSNADNIKAIAFLVEGAVFSNMSEVQEIRIKLCAGRFNNKVIRIVASDFPRFNSTRILDRYESAVAVR